MSDYADDLLPRRHFLRVDFARELLEQVEAMHPRIESKLTFRHMEDFRLATDLHREQRVAEGSHGLAQTDGHGFDDGIEIQALEFATFGKQASRCDIAVQDSVIRVDEYQSKRGALHDGIEQ